MDFVCALSRLPIVSGNEVRLVLLRDNHNAWGDAGNRANYSYSWWEPWSFPLRAIYQGGRRFRTLGDELTWEVLLIGHVMRRKQGALPWECPVDASMNCSKLLEAVLLGRVRARTGREEKGKRYRSLALAAIHTQVWEYLMHVGKSIHESPTEAELKYLREEEMHPTLLEATGKCTSVAVRAVCGPVYAGMKAVPTSREHALDRAQSLKYHPKKYPSESFWDDVGGMGHVSKAMDPLRLMWVPSTGVGACFQGDFKMSSGMHREFARIAASLRSSTAKDSV